MTHYFDRPHLRDPGVSREVDLVICRLAKSNLSCLAARAFDSQTVIACQIGSSVPVRT